MGVRAGWGTGGRRRDWRVGTLEDEVEELCLFGELFIELGLEVENHFGLFGDRIFAIFKVLSKFGNGCFVVVEVLSKGEDLLL